MRLSRMVGVLFLVGCNEPEFVEVPITSSSAGLVARFLWLQADPWPDGDRVLIGRCESQMIHSVTTATVRDLRTKFPRLKAIIAREGELIVTDRGRPAYVLRAFTPRPAKRPARIDYFARLKAHQPRPLSRSASKALDEHDRGER